MSRNGFPNSFPKYMFIYYMVGVTIALYVSYTIIIMLVFDSPRTCPKIGIPMPPRPRDGCPNRLRRSRFVQRVIGSIRRACLGHVVVLTEHPPRCPNMLCPSCLAPICRLPTFHILRHDAAFSAVVYKCMSSCRFNPQPDDSPRSQSDAGWHFRDAQ